MGAQAEGAPVTLPNVRVLGLAALLLAAAAPARPAPDGAAAAERIRAHVEFLAGDLLEGRETGSRGHEIAARYVAAEFHKLGLKPAGDSNGWLMQVPLRKATHAAAPTIALTVGGRPVPLVHGRDLALRPSLTEKLRSFSAPLVFVGHGISDRRLRIDDYAGLDVRGKIVVALRDMPPSIPSDVAAHLQSAQVETAAAHGAIGFVEVEEGERGAQRLERMAARPVIDWVDSAGRSRKAGSVRARLTLSAEVANRLFAGARLSLAAFRAQFAAGHKPSGFPLPARLSVTARSEWKDFTSPNVVARLPGSDPRLAAEQVVLMGHLDHLGLNPGAKPSEDAVYNGALDNAAGIATMIEAARHFAGSGKAPRRSLLFIATTGEEQGLLGADYFAARSRAPSARIVGLVNLDMPLLLYDFTDVIAFGAEHSTIARAVAGAGMEMGVAVAPDPMPQESLFVRSDHYPFVRQGVPSVFLMTGHANGGRQAWERFLAQVYHKPNDDVSQPINWRAGARFAELNYRIARRLADADERPLWYAGDYFGDRFAPRSPRAPRQP